MVLTLVKTTSETKWLHLWKFEPLKGKWHQETRYPVPYEIDDSRFHQAILKADAEGLVFFEKSVIPGKGNPFKIQTGIIQKVLSNPPQTLKPIYCDFDSYWRKKEQAEYKAKYKTTDDRLQRFKVRYDAGEKLPQMVVKLLQKEGLI